MGKGQKNSVIIDLVCRTWKALSRETLRTAMKEGRGTGNGAILAERRLRPSFYLSTHSLSIRAHRSTSQRRQPASFFYGTARPKTTIETEGRGDAYPLIQPGIAHSNANRFLPREVTDACLPVFARSGVGM